MGKVFRFPDRRGSVLMRLEEVIARLPEPRISDINWNAVARDLGYDYAAQQAEHDRRWAQTQARMAMAVLLGAMVGIILGGLVVLTRAADNGQWNDLPPNVRQWFQSPRIQPCCSLADGTRTDWEIKDGGYWVPVPWHPQGREYWERVPDGVVITDAGNPVGVALIWYNIGGMSIRCFVPGGGV
jgi:hypothetical protein